MAYNRTEIVNQAKLWLGCNESDGSHKKIIDVYNAHNPLARNYRVKYTDHWCATFVSAVAIKCGYTKIIPLECSCYYMIEGFKKLNRWVEADDYTPKPGDIIFYDWQDSGRGDNVGTPDHVGVVETVTGGNITVIEGNYSEAVKRRTMAVNARYIRGYGVPKYDDNAPVKTETTKPETVRQDVDSADFYSKSIAGTYKVTASSLNVRTGAGTGKRIRIALPKGTTVQNYGYYSMFNGVKWLYVQFTHDKKIYTGFCSSKWLRKA